MTENSHGLLHLLEDDSVRKSVVHCSSSESESVWSKFDRDEEEDKWNLD